MLALLPTTTMTIAGGLLFTWPSWRPTIATFHYVCGVRLIDTQDAEPGVAPDTAI